MAPSSPKSDDSRSTEAEIEKQTREKVEELEFEKPTIFGGIIKDPALRETTFLTQTVPDVQPHTRILAVCGVTDHKSAANPTKDGWFLSDFYAFNILLRGEGVAQTWLTTESPTSLVSKYKGYLHGAPYQARKVVLDQDILKDSPPQNIQVVDRLKLLDTFMSTVKSECDIARAEDQPLLVMMFCHGDARTKGVYLGLDRVQDKLDYPFMSIDKFRAAIGWQVRVALLSTACLSGAWAVSPSLNTTTLAAAGCGKGKNDRRYITGQSESWIPSVTFGRLCGSIYATAVIKALTAESPLRVEKDTESKEIQGSAASVSKDTQADTYNTFAGTIYRILFTRVDKWAAAHDIRFSAQDDEWSREWHARIGFPLSHYALKWSILREVVPDPAAVNYREPTYEEDKGTSERIKGASGSLEVEGSGIRGFFNGNLPALRSAVQYQGKMYLRSDPGRDTVASNVALHNAIQRLEKGDDFDFDMLEEVHTQIDYRLRAMNLADLFVEALGVPKPGGMRCAEWNWKSADTAEVSNRPQFDEIWQKVEDHELIHHPSISQGRQFAKPNIYIATALVLAELDYSTLDAMLTRCTLIRDNAISNQVEEISRFRVIKTVGQRYFSTLGKRLRSLSPVKRNRAVLSLSPSRGRRRSVFGGSNRFYVE